jgi:hypothetical protein
MRMKLSTMEGSLESYMRAHNEMQIKVHPRTCITTCASTANVKPVSNAGLSHVMPTGGSPTVTLVVAWHGSMEPCTPTCPARLLIKLSVLEQMRDVESRLQLAEFGKSANENGDVLDASSPEVAQKVRMDFLQCHLNVPLYRC